MKFKLPASVSSPQDLTSLILEVRDYAKWLAHESIKRRANVRRKPEPPVMSPAATELLREWSSHESLNNKSIEALIYTLEEYKHHAPSLTITLAAPPTSGIKATLVGWCRENISPDVLVNFQFNATLLGGMVVRCGSHVFDWSFRRQLLDNRNKFPEVLRRV